MSNTSLTQDRVIRVFVSSTFRDMQAERDELVLRIFPHLRQLRDERDVTWGEIDLRWDISDEQKADGQVLPICLEGINRCRPYFIGLLGERYGWIPGAIPAEVLETEDDQSLQKLNRFKNDIRQQHREGKLKYEPRENYPNAKSLGERVVC